MEMDSLFDQESGHAADAPDGAAPADAAHQARSRIRELSEEHRALVGDDDVARRRAVAIARHRRRLDASPEAERADRLAVRRALQVIS